MMTIRMMTNPWESSSELFPKGCVPLHLGLKPELPMKFLFWVFFLFFFFLRCCLSFFFFFFFLLFLPGLEKLHIIGLELDVPRAQDPVPHRS
jgi:hypothetical protein